METNPFFWLGEIGLVLAIIFSYGLIEITKSQYDEPGKSRPIYFTLPIWGFMITAVFLAINPLIRPEMDSIPAAAFLHRFTGGCMVTGAFFYFRYGYGLALSADAVKFFNRLLLISALTGTLVLALVGFRLALYRANVVQQQANRLEQIRQQIDKEGIRADTVTKAEVKAALDSNARALELTRKELTEAKARLKRIEQKAGLAATRKQVSKIDAQTNQIKSDADTIKNYVEPQPPISNDKPKKKFRLWPFSRRTSTVDSVSTAPDSLLTNYQRL